MWRLHVLFARKKLLSICAGLSANISKILNKSAKKRCSPSCQDMGPVPCKGEFCEFLIQTGNNKDQFALK
ncbi:hypothetical protein AM228_17235 [Planktothricoides sp. SR001]|nr:hypothetical protein AM228_17235 [Planktothricoides sp. SR001]